MPSKVYETCSEGWTMNWQELSKSKMLMAERDEDTVSIIVSFLLM